jgi:hypothetical protein
MFSAIILTTFLDDVEHVLAGRWKFGEDYIREEVKANAKRIQSLKSKVIRFDIEDFGRQEIHLITVDTVNFLAQEFRLNPRLVHNVCLSLNHVYYT